MSEAPPLSRSNPPDFDLAELRGFDPRILMLREEDDEQTRSAKHLTLILAVVFNDLKALAWGTYQLGDVKPVGPLDRRHGQWLGMLDSFDRLSCGLMRELAEAVRRHGVALQLPAFVDATQRLAPPLQEAWNDVLALAHQRKPRRKLIDYYRAVRDDLIFHYDISDDHIAQGYQKFFSVQDGTPARAKAYVSFGKSMEESRFYFADAAVMAAGDTFMARFGVATGVKQEFLRNVNKALRFIVQVLLEHFEAEEVRRGSRRW